MQAKDQAWTRIGALLAVGLLCSGLAGADRVVLKNGRVLEGRARSLASGEVEISSSMGVLRISSNTVERIERSETSEERIAVLARRPGLSAQALFDLASAAEDGGSVTLARRLLWRVIELDSDHQRARFLLGFRLFEGRWVTEEEWRRLHGEVLFRGEWMRAEDRARLRYLEAMQRQLAQQRGLESERFARWQQARAVEPREIARQAPWGGIPLGYVWAPASPVVVPPAFVPLPPQRAPGGRVTPPATGPPPAPRAKRLPVPSPPTGRSSVGRFRRQ